jgi:adenosylmethionine-8-amino-7-oxononanoate aminotransferase
MDPLLRFDRDHVWHPYASMTVPAPTYRVSRASGVRLTLDVEGREVEAIDAMSSWWCAIHGYAVPELDAAARAQLDSMSHVMFGGLTHSPAIELARRLIDLTPDPLQHVFFADSGSVAVEVAMKMAWQAHAADGLRRTKMFTIRGGYHGDTFAAMSVCDPDGGMHAMYAGLVPDHVFAPRPPAGVDRLPDDPEFVAWEVETRRLFAEHADEIAAVIIEPLLQGAGGMHLYSPHAVQVLAELAREHGALVIFDEIATGFWRTGTRWALDRCEVVPDILCLGKALTGGYLTLAAVLTTREVAERVDASPAGAMMHGPTFMANPLACSIALASVDLLERGDPGTRIDALGGQLRAALEPARGLASVADVRGIGAVGVIELTEPARGAEIARVALERGVWVRPFRNLVYTMPPYVSTPDDLAAIGDALVTAVKQVHG